MFGGLTKLLGLGSGQTPDPPPSGPAPVDEPTATSPEPAADAGIDDGMGDFLSAALSTGVYDATHRATLITARAAEMSEEGAVGAIARNGMGDAFLDIIRQSPSDPGARARESNRLPKALADWCNRFEGRTIERLRLFTGTGPYVPEVNDPLEKWGLHVTFRQNPGVPSQSLKLALEEPMSPDEKLIAQLNEKFSACLYGCRSDKLNHFAVLVRYGSNQGLGARHTIEHHNAQFAIARALHRERSWMREEVDSCLQQTVATWAIPNVRTVEYFEIIHSKEKKSDHNAAYKPLTRVEGGTSAYAKYADEHRQKLFAATDGFVTKRGYVVRWIGFPGPPREAGEMSEAKQVRFFTQIMADTDDAHSKEVPILTRGGKIYGDHFRNLNQDSKKKESPRKSFYYWALQIGQIGNEVNRELEEIAKRRKDNPIPEIDGGITAMGRTAGNLADDTMIFDRGTTNQERKAEGHNWENTIAEHGIYYNDEGEGMALVEFHAGPLIAGNRSFEQQIEQFVARIAKVIDDKDWIPLEVTPFVAEGVFVTNIPAYRYSAFIRFKDPNFTEDKRKLWEREAPSLRNGALKGRGDDDLIYQPMPTGRGPISSAEVLAARFRERNIVADEGHQSGDHLFAHIDVMSTPALGPNLAPIDEDEFRHHHPRENSLEALLAIREWGLAHQKEWKITQIEITRSWGSHLRAPRGGVPAGGMAHGFLIHAVKKGSKADKK